jgi:hypothetical protein
MWSEFTNSNLKLIDKKSIINNINPIFIDEIKKIRNNINEQPEIKYIIKKCNISLKKLNVLKNTQWVSSALSFDNLDYEVNISWKNNNIYLKTTKLKFDKFKKRLGIFLKVIDAIQAFDKQPIIIYYVLSNLKKYIDNKVISPRHINSGYTDLISNEIFIWREEEFEKVTFHELFHLLDKDHRNQHVKLPIKINGPESFYEAITDFKAIVYNIIYISLNTHKKIVTLINYEYFFIHNQAKYILGNLNNNNNIIIQNTPAYSYYVLKYYIFKYFIGDSLSKLLFDNIIYKNIDYNILIKIIKNYKISETTLTNFKSARMTLFELE